MPIKVSAEAKISAEEEISVEAEISAEAEAGWGGGGGARWAASVC